MAVGRVLDNLARMAQPFPVIANKAMMRTANRTGKSARGALEFFRAPFPYGSGAAGSLLDSPFALARSLPLAVARPTKDGKPSGRAYSSKSEF